jgi:hypothetical protein
MFGRRESTFVRFQTFSDLKFPTALNCNGNWSFSLENRPLSAHSTNSSPNEQLAA